MFMNRPVNIVLQNENGPCPLLSIANVLILQGNLQIHPDRSEVTSDQLIEMIGTHLIDKNPPLKDENLRKNQQQTLDDIMGILPTMENGLDVNVRFDKVSSFEYDARISVFDMLGVSLYHGWVADPSDVETFEVVGKMSYNQLVDRIILADTKKMEHDRKHKKEEAGAEETEDEQQEENQQELTGIEEREKGGQKEEEDEKEEGGDSEGENGERSKDPVTAKQQIEDEESMELLRKEVEELQSTVQEKSKGSGEISSDEELNRERAEEEAERELAQAIVVKQESNAEQEEKQKYHEGEEEEKENNEDIEETEEIKALKREATVAQRFLQETASQLTYLGLTELHSNVDERKLCVFFRNNHFSTMFRKDGELYLLLTDAGYEKQHAVAWEKLNEINGDTEIVSPEFNAPTGYINLREDVVSANSSDRHLALQLQQEENRRAAATQERSPQRATNDVFIENQRRALEAYKRQQQQGNRSGRNRRGNGDERAKKSGCTLS